MTDPISPIEGLPIQNLQAQVSVSRTESSAASKAPSNVQDKEIDFVRLQSDRDYFSSTLQNVLYRARTFYNQFRYDAAREQYAQFFRFVNYYRGADALPVAEYFPALFEYSFAVSILGQRNEAEKILNKELMTLLEPTLTLPKPALQETRKVIQQFQEQGLLPSATNTKVDIPAQVLSTLAQRFIAAGEPQIAVQVLGFLEVRALLEIYQTRQLLRTLYARENVNPKVYQTLTPDYYQHYGLPILLGLKSPQTPEKPTSKVLQSEYHVEHVASIDAIQPIDQNPRERDQRGRRQKSPKKRAVKKNVKANPQITL